MVHRSVALYCLLATTVNVYGLFYTAKTADDGDRSADANHGRSREKSPSVSY